MMLDHFLPLVCSTCFLRQPRATSSGVTLLTVVWLLSCQAFQSRKWIIVSLIGQYWSQWLKSKFNERLSLKIKVKVNRRRNSLLMSVSTHASMSMNIGTPTHIHTYTSTLKICERLKVKRNNLLIDCFYSEFLLPCSHYCIKGTFNILKYTT